MSTKRRPTRRTSGIGGDDPVVAEIRRVRAAMWEEAGRDVERYFENARRAGGPRVTTPARGASKRRSGKAM